jgi:hypothetical protein
VAFGVEIVEIPQKLVMVGLFQACLREIGGIRKMREPNTNAQLPGRTILDLSRIPHRSIAEQQGFTEYQDDDAISEGPEIHALRLLSRRYCAQSLTFTLTSYNGLCYLIIGNGAKRYANWP